MFCSKCGKKYPDDFSFCPYCGTIPPVNSSVSHAPKHKHLDKGFRLGLICLIIVFAISIAFLSWNKAHKLPDNAPAITVEEYHSIKDGMTYNQIKTIVGSSGKEISRTKEDGFEIVVVEWNGETSGSSADVKFQNGISIAKVQIGIE